MNDDQLNQKLASLVPPAMSLNLQDRILAEAKAVPNSRVGSFSKRFIPIAASILAICLIGYTVYQPSQNTQAETEIWQEAALDLGFDEIYSWVEGEESFAQ